MDADECSTRCVDCGDETAPDDGDDKDEPWEYYMVEDTAWSAAGMPKSGGCLCVGCLEARLGRRLVPADFKDVPVNKPTDHGYCWEWRTDRLADRLGVPALPKVA